MKYRKKPVVVEAEVYSEGMEDGVDCNYNHQGECLEFWGISQFCDDCKGNGFPHKKPYINTLEGKHYISKGDYIIIGVKGERYPCKPDIFKATYEEVVE